MDIDRYMARPYLLSAAGASASAAAAGAAGSEVSPPKPTFFSHWQTLAGHECRPLSQTDTHQAVVTLLEREVHVRVDAASMARSCASLSARWRIWCLGGCTFGLCLTPASASYADLYCASGCGPLPPVWYWPGPALAVGPLRPPASRSSLRCSHGESGVAGVAGAAAGCCTRLAALPAAAALELAALEWLHLCGA